MQQASLCSHQHFQQVYYFSLTCIQPYHHKIKVISFFSVSSIMLMRCLIFWLAFKVLSLCSSIHTERLTNKHVLYTLIHDWLHFCSRGPCFTCSFPPHSLPTANDHNIMSASNKCALCKSRCWDRQFVIKCKLCHSKFHARCLNEGDRTYMDNTNRYINFTCSICLKNILPFQKLSDESFRDEIDSI